MSDGQSNENILWNSIAKEMPIIQRSAPKKAARRNNQSIRLTRQKDTHKNQNGVASCLFLLLAFMICSHFASISMTQRVKVSTKNPSDEQLDSLQNCSVSFVPPPPRQESEWRRPLWVPSYPASGSASPSKQGDVVKDIIDRLFGMFVARCDVALDNDCPFLTQFHGPSSGRNRAVKHYHSSVRNQLRRCKGISETVGCSQGGFLEVIASCLSFIEIS
jgi:hypothetical protein